ncbi:MAG: hypothetical protein QW775_02585 [Ignisphaera sp.]|uniref:Uncharacterized protein n=1 Tax=Ignisphaera aggregans TaxID=334771 RepID=A0A7C4JLZ1_9CREN
MITIRHTKRFAIEFTALVLLFFLPAIPYIAEAMLRLHSLSISLYWILLTIVSMLLGIKAIKGVE